MAASTDLDPRHPLHLAEGHHGVGGPVVEDVVDTDQVVVQLDEPTLQERDVDAVRAQRQVGLHVTDGGVAARPGSRSGASNDARAR